MPSLMGQTDLTATSPQARAAASQRWDAIDVARGIAIAAMIVYHFSWDLSFLQLIGTNILQVPAWRWFARAIAGSFLALAGFGLALAHVQGFRRVPYLRRLMKVGGAALAVTLVTYFAFPQSYIFFGILHCIAVSSVLALPFLRLSPALTSVFAVFCLIAPWLFTSPAFDAPWLDWLGLGASDPVTNDYVPIFPWFGLVLIGMAAGKLLLAQRETLGLARWRADNPLARLMVWGGRKSLPIYLTHQIILLGALYGVAQILGPNPSAACRQICLAQNGNPELCPSVCSCILQQVPERDIWKRLLANNAAGDDTTRISRAAQQCMRQSPPS
jgi:uncharacterized membrane protein